MKVTMEKKCLERGDDHALEVYGRLQGIVDLVSEEAKYCVKCLVDLSRSRSDKVLSVLTQEYQ